MRPLLLVVLLALASGFAGCVLPPAVTIASFVADGASLVGTGKTTTDHAISLLADEDCRLWRVLKGKPICQSDTTVVAVAKLPPPLPPHAASPALRPPEQNAAIAGFVVDEPNAHIAIHFPMPTTAAPVRAAPPVPRPTASSPAVVASFVLDGPDAVIPVRIHTGIVAPKSVAALGGPKGDLSKPARTKAAARKHQARRGPSPWRWQPRRGAERCVARW